MTQKWLPIDLCKESRRIVIEIALHIAHRLQTGEQVEAVVAAMDRQMRNQSNVPWMPYSIARGYAGLAIFYGYFDQCFPEQGWDRVAHHHLEKAVQGIEQQASVGLGLFSGLSGLAFATWYLSRGGKRYRTLRRRLNDVLIPQIITVAEAMKWPEQGADVGQFDLISGLTGIGVYLNCHWQESGHDEALRKVLMSLGALILTDDAPPRWHTPAHFVAENLRPQFPQGNLNCGLAHGLPGPLALLSLTRIAGVEVQGLAETIHWAADWLISQSFSDEWGLNWPVAVPLRSPPEAAVSSSVSASHAGWCYGSPSIARALWLASSALGDDHYRNLALAAMRAAYLRPIAQRKLYSPTFCHGLAGLLQITLRFSNDSGDPLFAAEACQLVDQIVSKFTPTTSLGFENLEAEGKRVDHPGVLDGAPSVVLALLAAVTSVEPYWDRLFLLS
jgi:lantibiotic biosynthesis protein